MNADVISIIVFAVVTLSLLVTKTNVAFVTMALCSGYVLSSFIGTDIYRIVTDKFNPNSNLTFPIIQLTLLLLPALLVWHHFRKSQKGGTRFIAQLLPAAALAILFSVLIFDSLPSDAQKTLQEQSFIHGQIRELRNWLVALAIGLATLDILIQHAGQKRHYRKHHKGLFKKH